MRQPHAQRLGSLGLIRQHEAFQCQFIERPLHLLASRVVQTRQHPLAGPRDAAVHEPLASLVDHDMPGMCQRVAIWQEDRVGR